MSRWTADMIRSAIEKNPHISAVTDAIGVGGPGMQHTCKLCGIVFYAAPSRDRKYCSFQCAYADPERTKSLPQCTPKERGSATCIECGTVFVLRTGGGKKYCTQACSYRAIGSKTIRAAQKLRAARDPLKTLTFNCKICGKEKSVYRTVRNKNIYCSNKCSSQDSELKNQRVAKFLSSPKPNVYSRCAKGWVEVGGKRIFVKSQWEANYAFYLQFLKESCVITDWHYEVDVFWFDKIKRGVRSYLPDFRVEVGLGVEYHEVKGWMDGKSITKLKRMKKYHPSVTVVLRDQKWFKWASKNGPSSSPGWGTVPVPSSKRKLPREKKRARKS